METESPQFGKQPSTAVESPQFGKQIGQGKLTYTAIIFGVITIIMQLMGKTFPREEAEALVLWTESNWPAIQAGIALAVAFYGRFRREFR